MDVNEQQLNEMIQALEESMVVQQKYSKALQELKEENQFLSDTILNNKLGKISTERRELLAKVRQSEKTSQETLTEANAIKLEYEAKLDKIASMIKDVKLKQSDINSFIDSETQSKIADIKSDYNSYKKEFNKKYNKHVAENDALLQKQLIKYRKQHIIIITCGIICIIISILGRII